MRAGIGVMGRWMALIKPTVITLDVNVTLKRSVLVQQPEKLFLPFMFGILNRNNTESWCFPWTELAADSWKFWGWCIFYFPVSLGDQHLRLQRCRGKSHRLQLSNMMSITPHQSESRALPESFQQSVWCPEAWHLIFLPPRKPVLELALSSSSSPRDFNECLCLPCSTHLNKDPQVRPLICIAPIIQSLISCKNGSTNYSDVLH